MEGLKMIVYKFEKLRKWVQVLSDGRWRSMPFGTFSLDYLNTMYSGKDFETFKKMYANQISPFMMNGYSTEYGKKAVAEIKSNLKDENKMQKMFEKLREPYECVKSDLDYLYENLPFVHKCRTNRRKDLQTIFDCVFDIAFRFNVGIPIEEKKDIASSDSEYDSYRKSVFQNIRMDGVYVHCGEFTDGKEEIAKKYIIEPPSNDKENEVLYEWYMFPLDFEELLFNQDISFIIKTCSHCGALYATSYPQTVYCDCCRSNDVPNTIRKNNKCRQLHKNIMELINNCKDSKTISRYAGLIAPDNTLTYHFRTESNYYWSVCQGKKPKTEKMAFYEDITNEKQYYEWLQKIHEEIKA